MIFSKLSTLLTASTTGLWERRSISATLESASTRPCLHVYHEHNHICGINGDLRLFPHLGQNDVAAVRLDSTGIDQGEIDDSATLHLRRSGLCVTPGVSFTIEMFSPASALNRVDFPTFGRPTIATIGLLIYLMSSFSISHTPGIDPGALLPSAHCADKITSV